MKNSNKSIVTSNKLKDGKDHRDLSLVTRHSLLILLFVICYWLLSAGIPEAAEKSPLMDDIRQAVLNELKGTVSENVELNGIRIMKGAEIAGRGEVYSVVNTAMSGYNGRNKVIFSIALAGKETGVKHMTVEASYDVMVDVIVSAKPLASGTMMTGDDFYTVRERISKVPAGAVSSLKEVEGKVLKSSVGQGIVLRSNYFTSQASMKRGQKVNVVVEGDSVSISAQGQLRNDAVIGGVARVLCDISKKEVNGILIAPNTVKVKI